MTQLVPLAPLSGTGVFELRSGVTLADAAVWYEPVGGRFDIGAALLAGGGRIRATSEGLAAALRAVLAGDGLPVLVETVA